MSLHPSIGASAGSGVVDCALDWLSGGISKHPKLVRLDLIVGSLCEPVQILSIIGLKPTPNRQQYQKVLCFTRVCKSLHWLNESKEVVSCSVLYKRYSKIDRYSAC